MYLSPRTERIQKLTDKLNRIGTALIEYPYTNQNDIIEDWTAFEATEKELQIQKAYYSQELSWAFLNYTSDNNENH